MQRRTLLKYAGVGAVSVGVANGVTGTALAGCVDVSFEVDDRESGDDESVDVDCGTPTTVDGRIVGTKSCHTADLVDYGREDDDLQFWIETVEDGHDCTDHHVTIGYTIHADGLDDEPAGVCVYHDGDRVARVDCADDDSDEPADHSDDPPEFDFDDRETPEFDFDIDEEPKFDMDVDEGEPQFDIDVDEGEPQFDVDVNEEEPEFDFDVDDEPEFDFDVDEEPTFDFDIDEEPEFSMPD